MTVAAEVRDGGSAPFSFVGTPVVLHESLRGSSQTPDGPAASDERNIPVSIKATISLRIPIPPELRVCNNHFSDSVRYQCFLIYQIPTRRNLVQYEIIASLPANAFVTSPLRGIVAL